MPATQLGIAEPAWQAAQRACPGFTASSCRKALVPEKLVGKITPQPYVRRGCFLSPDSAAEYLPLLAGIRGAIQIRPGRKVTPRPYVRLRGSPRAIPARHYLATLAQSATHVGLSGEMRVCGHGCKQALWQGAAGKA